MKTQIAIIGAGVAGCTAAIALAPYYEVILIDKLEKPGEKIGECLPAATKRILSELEILHLVQNEKGHSISSHINHTGTQSTWGSEKIYFSDSLINPDGSGWFLDRVKFESSLRSEVNSRGVKCLWPKKLLHVEKVKEGWKLTIGDNLKDSKEKTETLEAGFVIDATGRASVFAGKLGIPRISVDKLISCWSIFPGNRLNNINTVSPCEYGWWYSSPLSNNRRLAAFHTDRDLLKKRATRDPQLFLDLMKNCPEISSSVDYSEYKGFVYKGTVAANSGYLQQFTGERWVAIGDSAISFDPLSSQGMFNAMANAMQLRNLFLGTKLIEFSSDQNLDNKFREMYINSINQVWNRYLYHKEHYYRQEKRWIHAPFWKRRISRSLQE
ncbi:tryptophan 7-halogenase [Zunongwangia sp. F363]|uniref:Tryptophan 7-halogenase n=1 Tax=Autumnicola tepida TaxID=3075595 RepID=A0ABU3C7A0_9FLAO|nr:FAD-dependent monooxygenase [Zunongwangia sp. F363]MDT0642197.1 tryptophan 7-halogenase [Zunongwangia sp. F363]